MPKGAQWASRSPGVGRPASVPDPHDAVDRPARSGIRVLVVSVLALLLTFGALPAGTTPTAEAADGAPRAVVIVGPAASSTTTYLQDGERIARQAEAQGMDVRRMFTPRATWPRVKAALQGANLVAYLGHGNGWPSNLGPFRGESKNGFGLNPCEGCGTSSPVKYFGEDLIRSEVRLARNAVVLLRGLCYASGNAESWMPAVFDRDLATARASNFAAGFLDAGAGAVFALGWRQNLDLPAALMNGSRTMDQIFRTPASSYSGAYDGFVGWSDYTRDSTRTRGARVHLDPHPTAGHLRALTGDLGLTAGEWRGGRSTSGTGGGSPDRKDPALRIKGTSGVDRAIVAASARGPIGFSPDGDGVADVVTVRANVSERSRIDVEVRDPSGRAVRHVRAWHDKGAVSIRWAGRDDRGRIVRDGRYTIRMTPRDRAGNVGKTRTVAVRVVRVATAPRRDRPAIQVRDGDRLATGVKLRTTIAAAATVRWVIRRDGRTVATLFDGKARRGTLAVRWDGRDRKGRFVADGTYTAVLVATSASGTVRRTTFVWVGAFRTRLTPADRATGRRAVVHLTSTEPLAGAPLVELRRSGMDSVRIRARVSDDRRSWVRVPASMTATKGRLTIRVIGTDRGGQTERGTTSVRIR